MEKIGLTYDETDGVIKLDACGLQCPIPIIKLAECIKMIEEGKIVEISSTDHGFASDVGAWCEMTGNTLLSLNTEGNIIKALIIKGKNAKAPVASKEQAMSCGYQPESPYTIVMFSNDLDKALAAFMIANGAKAAGKSVTMFFTFWGLNVLRKSNGKSVKKGLVDKMFGLMMPKGAEKLVLSKMNMGGVGSWMMKSIMKKKNVSSLAQLIETAKNCGVKMLVCSTSMDLMGIKPEELVDGIEICGVAKYVAESEKSVSNLFI